MNLQQAVDLVKEFAAANTEGRILEGAELMDIHSELGLLSERERVAITMFMTAGRRLFAPVDSK